MPALDLAAGGQTKALRCSFVGLKFRHDCSFVNRESQIVNRNSGRRCWARTRRLWLFSRLVSPGLKNCEQLIPFHSGRDFNFTNILQVVREFLENARAQLAVRHFATTKPD